jgi:hypothetical protein
MWVGQGGRGDDVCLRVSDPKLAGHDRWMSLVQGRQKLGFGYHRGW